MINYETCNQIFFKPEQVEYITLNIWKEAS